MSSNQESPTKYTFGTNEGAARRLESIAGFFNPRALEWITRHVHGPVASGLDLGCGPGYTTDMLSRALPGARVTGLDRSESFLEMARAAFPHLVFQRHDITTVPFPLPAQVLYARFLLSHLPGPVELVNRWAGQLPPAGLLFIEELEHIDTDIPVFKDYLAVNTRLIQSQGADLFVGRTLAAGTYAAEVVANEPVRWPVANFLAATWFYPNTIGPWEHEAFILDNYAAEERKAISRALLAIRDSGDSRQDIVWTMRRIVLRRVSA